MQVAQKMQNNVQIETIWGVTPLDVIQVPEKSGTILAGSASSCPVPVPLDLLPFEDFPLIEVTPQAVKVRGGKQLVIEQELSPNQWIEPQAYPDWQQDPRNAH